MKKLLLVTISLILVFNFDSCKKEDTTPTTTSTSSSSNNNNPPSCNLTVAVTSTDETSSGSNDGTVTATPSNGASPYVYNWSNTGSAQTMTNLAPNTYSVTVTDADSCTAFGSAIVGSGGSSAGILIFQVYQKCAGTPSEIKNGAYCSIYNSQSDLNSGNFIYNQTTQGDGTTTMNNLAPQTYYYKVNGTINSGNCNNIVREETSTVLISAGSTTTKTVTLQQ